MTPQLVDGGRKETTQTERFTEHKTIPPNDLMKLSNVQRWQWAVSSSFKGLEDKKKRVVAPKDLLLGRMRRALASAIGCSK